MLPMSSLTGAGKGSGAGVSPAGTGTVAGTDAGGIGAGTGPGIGFGAGIGTGAGAGTAAGTNAGGTEDGNAAGASTDAAGTGGGRTDAGIAADDGADTTGGAGVAGTDGAGTSNDVCAAVGDVGTGAGTGGGTSGGTGSAFTVARLMSSAATLAIAITVPTGCTGTCGIADASPTKTLDVFSTMKFESKHFDSWHEPDHALATKCEVSKLFAAVAISAADLGSCGLMDPPPLNFIMSPNTRVMAHLRRSKSSG